MLLVCCKREEKILDGAPHEDDEDLPSAAREYNKRISEQGSDYSSEDSKNSSFGSVDHDLRRQSLNEENKSRLLREKRQKREEKKKTSNEKKERQRLCC